MTTEDIIAGINRTMEEYGITRQQAADGSKVPKSTLDRILRGDTPNPSMQTILDIAAAVGYTFSNHPEQPPAAPGAAIKDPMVNHMITIYENRGRAYEERIKRDQAHYNQLLAEKNRWLRFSMSVNLILVVFLCGILLYDLTHLDRGWIQEVLSNYSNREILDSAVLAVRNFFLNICSV